MSNPSGNVSTSAASPSILRRFASSFRRERQHMQISRVDTQTEEVPVTRTSQRPSASKKPYVVDALTFDRGYIKGPVMSGYINAMNEIHQPLSAPRGKILTSRYLDLSKASMVEKDAVALLHEAYTLLKEAEPKLRITKSKLDKGDFSDRRLSREDVLFLTQGEVLARLTHKQLLDLVKSLHLTIGVSNRTTDKAKLKAGKLITKYLLETRLTQFEAVRSDRLKKAREKALKLLHGESTKPTLAQHYALNGICSFTPDEIGLLSLKNLHDELSHDVNGLLHLNANQMSAFIRRVKTLSENATAKDIEKVVELNEFISHIVAENLGLTARDVLEAHAKSQSTSADILSVKAKLKAIRSVMREARALQDRPKDLDLLSMLPEQIALLGSHDLMAMNLADITSLDHEQAMSLAFIMHEMGTTLKNPKTQAPKVAHKFHQVMAELRERVLGTMSYIDDKNINPYTKCTTKLINQTDILFHTLPLTHMYPLDRPLVTPIRLDPIRFVREFNFADLDEKSIQELDLNVILNMTPSDQLKWFISNDAQAILQCTNTNKMRAWLDVLRHLHHYCPHSSRLCIAIERHASFLRYNWLPRMKSQNADFSYTPYLYLQNCLDSILEVGHARQQIGTNNLVSLIERSRSSMSYLSTAELLHCDLREFSRLTPKEVADFAQTLWSRVNKDELADTQSTSFTIYKRLSWLHQQWVVRHFGNDNRQNVAEAKTIKIINSILESCVEHMPRIAPHSIQPIALPLMEREDEGVILPAPMPSVPTPSMAPISNYLSYTIQELATAAANFYPLNVFTDSSAKVQFDQYLSRLIQLAPELGNLVQRNTFMGILRKFQSDFAHHAEVLSKRGIDAQVTELDAKLYHKASFLISTLLDKSIKEMKVLDSKEKQARLLAQLNQLISCFETEKKYLAKIKQSHAVNRLKLSFAEKVIKISEFTYHNYYLGKMAPSNAAWKASLLSLLIQLNPELQNETELNKPAIKKPVFAKSKVKKA